MRPVLWGIPVVLCALFLAGVAQNPPVPHPAVAAVPDGAVAARRSELLAREAAHPFPSAVCTHPVKASDPCISGELSQALALLYLDRSAQDLQKGDALVADAVHRMPALQGFGDADGLRHLDLDEFHFGVGPQLYRIVALFGPGTGAVANRLEPQIARAAMRLFYDWARTSCPISDADSRTVWDIYGSENHEAADNNTCWGAAELLTRDPASRNLRYTDGSTPAQQLEAWTHFLERYIAERVKRGMLVEFSSPSYAGGTLQCFYAYYDFAHDPHLRSLAGAFLNLWWADWAQDELGGVQGGPKARDYPIRAITGNGAGDGTSYVYFGLAPLTGSPSPGQVMAFTSTFFPDLSVAELATKSRTAYVTQARSPGLATEILDGSRAIGSRMDPSDGIVRYSYVTSKYVMGMSLLARRPKSAWAGISDQNRWDGVTLGDVPGAVVFALPKPVPKPYNAEWGVQDKATQIVAKIPGPLSSGCGVMQIFVAKGLTRGERDGWIFGSDGAAYVAARPIRGRYSWDPTDTRFADLGDDTSPVILQASDVSTYPTLAAFEDAVVRMPIHAAGGIVDVRGLDGAAELTFFENGALPRVDGRDIDLAPPFTYRSPFINENWESGVVHISSGTRELKIDAGAASE